MPKKNDTAPVKASVQTEVVTTRTLNVAVGKENVVLVITNGTPSVAKGQGTPIARELARAILAAVVSPAPVVEAAPQVVTTRTAPVENGTREIRRRQPRAEMQAARLAGTIPCLKGKDPFGADLATLGIFNAEWEVGMPTSQAAPAPVNTPDAPEAPASQTTEF